MAAGGLGGAPPHDCRARRADQLRRAGPAATGSCSSFTGSPARGRTGSRTSRISRATHRVLALDLPGFGDSPMPPWDISIEAYGAAAPRLLRDRWRGALRGRSGTRWAGSSRPRPSAGSTAASRSSCWYRPPACRSAEVQQGPRGGIRPRRRRRRHPSASPGRSAHCFAPGCANSRFASIVRWPLRVRRELLWEQFAHGAAKPGFLPAFTQPGRLRHPRPARGRRAARADRLGAQRPHRSVGGR